MEILRRKRGLSIIEEIRILLGNASENFTDAQIGLNAKIALDFVETYTGCVIDYSLTLIADIILLPFYRNIIAYFLLFVLFILILLIITLMIL